MPMYNTLSQSDEKTILNISIPYYILVLTLLSNYESTIH